MSNRTPTASLGRRAAPWALGLFGLVGCGPEVAPSVDATLPPPETATEARALNGEANFGPGHDCTATERQTIRNALAIISGQVLNQTPAFIACLQDTFISPDDGADPELIVTRLAEDLPTSFACRDNSSFTCGGSTTWNACASVGIPIESLTFDRGFLASNTGARIASVLAHEVMHNKGFRHNGAADAEFPFSVNEQVEDCSLQLSGAGGPAGASRAAAITEVALAPAGDDGGVPFFRACEPGRFVQAISVAQDRAGLSGLRLRCAEASGTGSVRLDEIVGAAAQGAPLSCLSGQLVNGLQIFTSASRVTGVGPYCEAVSQLSGNGSPRGLLGTPGARFADRACPAGFAMQGLRGRASSAGIYRLEPVCRQVSATQPADMRKQPILGSLGGLSPRSNAQICHDEGVITQLAARVSPAAGVQRLTGLCRGTSLTSGTRTFRTTRLHPVAGIGDVRAGADGLAACPAGQGLVGLEATFDAGRVASVRGACANVGAWNTITGGAPTTSWMPTLGTARGSATRMECDRASFLVGFETTEATSAGVRGITAVQPICRSYRGPLAELMAPSNGSASLVSTPQTTRTFRWTDTGASRYHIYLGTSRGARDIATLNAGTRRELDISGIPSGTIYVRLWTHTDRWRFTDTTFRQYYLPPRF